MHWAHTSKSPISIYDVANDRTSRDNLILLGALHDAIDKGELEVWHQAKLKLATGELAATEALLRWNHPERGYVSPGSFIPQVEETMLINQVTHTVIATAFGHAARFRDAGYHLRVAVNLSVRNLRDRTLLESLDEHARQNGLDPAEIELEITESAVMEDPEHCIRLISVLRDRGYGVAIDDFGVGHSSLAYLRKLRVSSLKIDQDFVKTLVTDAGNQTIVRAIIGLAGSLGLETIAEGVEDERSIALLREWGCTYAQGYAIHKPAPADALLALLDERRAAPSGAVGAPAPAPEPA
jgi:EAL domain-containing protein (putative c-di-GMP-specific phosphodiesterase class I)